jgi:hypothetical protein
LPVPPAYVSGLRHAHSPESSPSAPLQTRLDSLIHRGHTRPEPRGPPGTSHSPISRTQACSTQGGRGLNDFQDAIYRTRGTSIFNSRRWCSRDSREPTILTLQSEVPRYSTCREKHTEEVRMNEALVEVLSVDPQASSAWWLDRVEGLRFPFEQVHDRPEVLDEVKARPR